MYEDLHAGRNLGHPIWSLIRRSSLPVNSFRKHISQTMQELNSVKPAPVLKYHY